MADSNDLIAAIYDAAVDPSGWEGVVKRIVKATKSVSGGLFIQETNAAHLSETQISIPSMPMPLSNFGTSTPPLMKLQRHPLRAS
jgi:hypothetical protein